MEVKFAKECQQTPAPSDILLSKHSPDFEQSSLAVILRVKLYAFEQKGLIQKHS